MIDRSGDNSMMTFVVGEEYVYTQPRGFLTYANTQAEQDICKLLSYPAPDWPPNEGGGEAGSETPTEPEPQAELHE